MKPIILQLGGIGNSCLAAQSPASSASSSRSSHSTPSPISASTAASSSSSSSSSSHGALAATLPAAPTGASVPTPRARHHPPGPVRYSDSEAVDLSVLGRSKSDHGEVTMTTVITNTMTEPQHPLHGHTLPHHHRPQHNSAGKPAHHHANTKSITRLLQHSILQLCNEHIGYTHKLQILGVLCMTVDDEQQELVVKVNNTLKRVGPVPGPKDAQHLAAAGMTTPTIQMLQPAHHHQTHHAQMHGTDLSISRGSSITREEGMSAPTSSGHSQSVSPAPSSMPLNFSGRKSHGRKGTNPTKVSQQVLEQVNDLDSDEDDEDEEPLTIITPEAPEASNPMASGPPSPSSSQTATGDASTASSTPTQYPRATSSAPSGSAKRKPSHQFRVPQYPSPVGSPYVRNPAPSESYSNEDGADGSGAASTARGTSTASSTAGSHQGISLPIYVAGTYTNHNSQDTNDQPINLAAGSSASTSISPEKHNGLPLITAVNGRESGEVSPACSSSVNGERPGSTSSIHKHLEMMQVKDEPDEDSETEYKDQYTSLEEYARANVAALFSGGEGVADRDARMEGLHAALPYTGIGMYMPRPGYDCPSPSRMDSGEGLTIKYTSTGPYTVGANGKDVSNSSRIKDIIMYDDQSPLSTQKGARIETDYIVDKLGMDGRKRRRRAPEDLLTPEEIAEYLGQPEHSDFNFRCKYCSEEFDSITRYIHHTLAAHQAYICHQCGKSFTTKSSLLRHRPIHTGMRRFACSICKKTFYRKDKCKAHIRRHLGLSSQTSGTPAQDASTSRLVQDAAPNTSDATNNNSQFPSPVEAASPTQDVPDSP